MRIDALLDVIAETRANECYYQISADRGTPGNEDYSQETKYILKSYLQAERTLLWELYEIIKEKYKGN